MVHVRTTALMLLIRNTKTYVMVKKKGGLYIFMMVLKEGLLVGGREKHAAM
jgi:hypothetical protein